MLSVYLCLVLVTPAILALDLNPQMLNEFKSVFSGAIDQHLQAEYVLLMPIIAKQNETWKSCKESVIAQKASCRSCVQSNCESPASDMVGEYLENFETMLEAPGHHADWNEWQEMGTTFFGKVPDMPTVSGNSGPGMFPGNGQGMDKRLFGALAGFAFTTAATIDFNTLFNQGNTLSNNWNGFTSTMEDVGSGIGDAANNVWNGISSWFGRRRRSVMSARRTALWRRRHFSTQMEGMNDESTECVEQCTECRPFFSDVIDEVISEVCGQHMVLDETNMAATIHELKQLYLANGQTGRGTPSILTKIEYNSDEFRLASMSFGEVYVTAMTPSGSVRYLSEYRLRMQSPETSAIEMAEELIEKWGL